MLHLVALSMIPVPVGTGDMPSAYEGTDFILNFCEVCDTLTDR